MSNLTLTFESLLENKALFEKVEKYITNGEGDHLQGVNALIGLTILIFLFLFLILVIECVRSFCDNKRYTFQHVQNGQV